MRSPAVLSVALLSLAAGACVTTVNRAALVPHMTPTLASGAPMQTPGEISLGASSVAHTTIGSSDDTAAVEVPGTQLEGALRARVGKHVAIGLIAAHGFDATAKPAKDLQPPVDNGDVRGYGMTVAASIPTGDPRWHVGLNFEGLMWTVPWVEYEACIDQCPFPYSAVETGTASVPQVALGVVPTYHTGRWNVWGGLSFRNHPTIEQKAIESSLDFSNDVTAGTFNTVLSAGADVDLGGGVRAGVTLYQTVLGQPVAYGPSVAAMLTLPLGARDQAPAPTPVTPPGAPGAL